MRWDWPHLRLIQQHLEAMERDELRRLMIFVPPRHGKSELATIRYPVWRLEREPAMRVIVGAYNQALASRFSRKARRIAEGRFALSQERSAADDWETPAGGGLRAVGVGSGVTGHGAQLIVIDDPVKSREEAESPAYRERVWSWYTDDLYTRLEPRGQAILIQTRWHEADLAGRILNSDDAGSWTVVSLPAEAEANDPLGRPLGAALCPERYDLDALASIKTVLGEYGYAALYQQRPAPAGGAIFKREWWDDANRFDAGDPVWPRRVVGRYISVDTAMKDREASDYSAFGVYELTKEYRLLVRQVTQRRLEFPDLLAEIERLATRYNHDGKLAGVLIEDKNSGTSALQTLRAMAPAWLAAKFISYEPHGSKEYRARQASAWAQRGMVWLPQPSAAAPWLFDFERQLYTFGAGAAHDDMVDTLTQAIIYLEHYLAAGWQAAVRGMVTSDDDNQQ